MDYTVTTINHLTAQIHLCTYQFCLLLKIANHSNEVVRTDRTLYAVMTYLATRRMEELTFTEFRRLATSLIPQKMVVLLTFLWKPSHLTPTTGWLAQQWSSVYDTSYVEGTLLAAMRRIAPDIQSLIAELQLRASPVESSETGSSGTVERKVTMPEPFSFATRAETRSAKKRRKARAAETAARAASLQPVEFKTKPIPGAIYARSLAEIERQKAQRRVDIAEQVRDRHQRDAKPFALLTNERPTHIERVRTEAEAEEKKRAEQFHARPPPDFSSRPPGQLGEGAAGMFPVDRSISL
jgi:hypothetical protein